MSRTLVWAAFAVSGSAFLACNTGVPSPTAAAPVAPASLVAPAASPGGHNHGTARRGTAMTQAELAQVHAATAKYHDHAAALADGYTILVPVGGLEYVPHMGYHYSNASLLGQRTTNVMLCGIASPPTAIASAYEPAGRPVVFNS